MTLLCGYNKTEMMTLSKRLLAITLMGLSLVGCGNAPQDQRLGRGATAKGSAWADKCCDCLQASMTMSARMQELIASGRREEVIRLAEEVGDLAEEGIDCCLGRWLLSEPSRGDSSRFSSILSGACPDIPPLLLEELVLRIGRLPARSNDQH